MMKYKIWWGDHWITYKRHDIFIAADTGAVWLIKDKYGKMDARLLEGAVVCRSTGLKDNEGVDIYENDILEIDWYDASEPYSVIQLGKVYWCEWKCMWDIEMLHIPNNFVFGITEVHHHSRVIGNILEG